jgi:hypothetical protein
MTPGTTVVSLSLMMSVTTIHRRYPKSTHTGQSNIVPENTANGDRSRNVVITETGCRRIGNPRLCGKGVLKQQMSLEKTRKTRGK